MEIFQYIISGSSKDEKTIWVCGKCKKDNMDKILFGKWKLIDNKSDDGTIPCNVCGAGLAKFDTVESLDARKEGFTSRFK